MSLLSLNFPLVFSPVVTKGVTSVYDKQAELVPSAISMIGIGMKSFTGWAKISDTRVSKKYFIGKHVPVVELEFMGGTFHCYESSDINDAVQVDDHFDSIEFEIQQDRKENCKHETTHLIHPVDGTIKLNGQLYEQNSGTIKQEKNFQ